MGVGNLPPGGWNRPLRIQWGLVFKTLFLGCLPGSVDRACNSLSQGHEFKHYVGVEITYIHFLKRF